MGLAFVAAANNEWEQVAWLLGASATLRDTTGEPLRPTVQSVTDEAAESARNALGEAKFSTTFAIGAAHSPDSAIAEVLSIAGGSGESQPGGSSAVTGDCLTSR